MRATGNKYLDSINITKLAQIAKLNRTPEITADLIVDWNGDVARSRNIIATYGSIFCKKVLHTESEYKVNINMFLLNLQQAYYSCICGSKQAAADFTYGLLMYEFRKSYYAQEKKLCLDRKVSCDHDHILQDIGKVAGINKEAYNYTIAASMSARQQALFELVKLQNGFENVVKVTEVDKAQKKLILKCAKLYSFKHYLKLLIKYRFYKFVLAK